MIKPGIAIHGGAGRILPNSLSPEREEQYTAALRFALHLGHDIVRKEGSALDAVEAAIKSLEDCPLFNAGKGSVYNSGGTHEMDASIMWGRDISAGAVSNVKNVKNPIALARAIMERSEHVFLCGEGAEEFARLVNLPFEPDTYFDSDFRFEQWKEASKKIQTSLDHDMQLNDNYITAADKKFGTVGAVALDINGNLAAGTSTGGMTNKKFGRIGDSPVIGAGTYANNNTCAISCTGHGELFIRAVAAHDISCLIEYKNLTLKQACEEVVFKKLVSVKGEGGLIAIDKYGNIELPFNTGGMYRAMKNDTAETIAIYK